jgi:hypothetical protein
MIFSLFTVAQNSGISKIDALEIQSEKDQKKDSDNKQIRIKKEKILKQKQRWPASCYYLC